MVSVALAHGQDLAEQGTARGVRGCVGQVSGPDVLREQLPHITRASREFDVTVQVVPLTADAQTALTASFVIIQWPDEHDAEAVYVDGETSWTGREHDGAIRAQVWHVCSHPTASSGW